MKLRVVSQLMSPIFSVHIFCNCQIIILECCVTWFKYLDRLPWGCCFDFLQMDLEKLYGNFWWIPCNVDQRIVLYLGRSSSNDCANLVEALKRQIRKKGNVCVVRVMCQMNSDDLETREWQTL